MNINIKITEGCGIIVNSNELSVRQANLKNQLYAVPSKPAERDRPPIAPKSTANRQQPQSAKKTVKVQDEQLRRFQKQMNSNIKQMSKNQASLGMLYTNNQIIKGQQEILTEQQQAINDLKQNKRKTQESDFRSKSVEPEDRQRQQQMLKDMTTGLNRQLEEIRKLRDDIMRTAKEFNETVSKTKAGEAPLIPTNLLEMNKNLKAMVQTSQQNIDLISPEKLEMLGKLQNFNLEGYTQHLNQLKSQIAMVHKQSEQVERDLKQRLSKLEKLTVSPKFQEQLLQPYQNNIKNKLSTIDLQQAKKRVTDRLGGEFDYVKFDIDLSTIEGEIRQEMSDFSATLQKYRISIPDLRLEPKELKALDVKMPSILEQYKNARGIVAQPQKQQPASFARTGDLIKNVGTQPRGTTEFARTGSVKRPATQNFQANRNRSQKKRSIEQLATKPKDFSTNIKYKNITNEQPFKTVLNDPTIQEKRRQVAKRTKQQPEQVKHHEPKGKTRQEEDFEKYLESRANEQLEELYKEKRDRMIRMKNELYDQLNSGPAVQLTLDKRNKVEFQKADRSQPKVQPAEKKVSKELPNDALGEAGRKLVDNNEGMVIREIGKEVLLEKIKNIFQVDRPVEKQPQPSESQPSNSNNIGSVTNFAEGFLSVINNTLSAMNRGLSANIQKKVRERQQRGGNDFDERKVQVPLPVLQEIPKPPVFTLKFDRNTRSPAPQQFVSQGQGYPTFSNFPQPQRQPQPIGLKNYSHLDVSDVSSYSQIELDKQEIKSQLSNISNTSNIDISRSGGLARSRQ